MRALLVDDEEPARLRLRGMLEKVGFIEVVGEAEDGESALEAVHSLRPDLVFLDIQMPGMTGLEVAASLMPPRPQVIFCTAYDQFAIEAFEHHAADYLLKPLNRDRLKKALDKVRGRHELAEAGRTQQALFPQGAGAVSTLDYDGSCRPARVIGGDYYDFLPVGEGKLCIVVADVAGKGLPAALTMAGLQARVQMLLADHATDPARLAAELNRGLCGATESNRYVTLFLGVYDAGERSLHYVNAGHEPPLWIRPDGEVRRLDSTGTVVGLFDGAAYESARVQLDPGDAIVAFSDGLTETTNAEGVELGEEPLAGWIRADSGSAAELRARIVERADAYRGTGAQADDLTVVVARVLS